MKRMRAVESDSVKLARKAKDKLHKACERASETHSLVPRPFPPPVFDSLQYKNGGEGLGERVTCVTSGRREGGGARSL